MSICFGRIDFNSIGPIGTKIDRDDPLNSKLLEFGN